MLRRLYGVYRMNDGGVWARMSNVEMDRFRLNGYEDFYLYNRDNRDVLEAYQYWIEGFYKKYVFSPYSRHKLTKNGLKNLCFYFRHCRKVNGLMMAVRKSLKCFVVLFGFKKS